MTALTVSGALAAQKVLNAPSDARYLFQGSPNEVILSPLAIVFAMSFGANRMQTTVRVVLPAALSGVAAAIVLGLSRAIGETMIVTLAAGSLKNLSLDPRENMQAMTGFIAGVGCTVSLFALNHQAVYTNLGLYDKATPLLRASLAQVTALRGPVDTSVAENLDLLGVVLAEGFVARPIDLDRPDGPFGDGQPRDQAAMS